jgi:hypothetical protein
MEQAPEISQIYYAVKVDHAKIEELLRKLEINIDFTP